MDINNNFSLKALKNKETSFKANNKTATRVTEQTQRTRRIPLLDNAEDCATLTRIRHNEFYQYN